MNSGQTEVELKFLVPRAAHAELAAEVARTTTTLERASLVAMYFDTDDRRLARAGMAWRLRREGRRWIQTLKAGGASGLERFEHEVIRPAASPDAAAHAGTSPGDRLLVLLRHAQVDQAEVGVRFQTEVRRTLRRVRTRGAVVEIALDEGRILAGTATQPILEIEFELASGSIAAMLVLAERWRKRFGLIYDPRSKAERGDRLAEGTPRPPVRKAAVPGYSGHAPPAQAFGTVLDECLAQITRNAIGLVEGDPDLRIEHVHQLRVGIRRLRSALRSFEGWAPAPPADLVERLRALFDTLGKARDSDVLDSGVAARLAEAGAPSLTLRADPGGIDPRAVVEAPETQQTFLAWIAWRATLDQKESAVRIDRTAARGTGGAPPSEGETPAAVASSPDGQGAAVADARIGSDATRPVSGDAPTFHRDAERRLRRWHRRIVADWKAFDELDDAGLHALRKRVKRQRYAVEFFASVLRHRKVERYLKPLAAIQDRMGELNDLFVARMRYQGLVEVDPAAWFALGWLAARIVAVRALAKPGLGRLVEVNSPRRCG